MRLAVLDNGHGFGTKAVFAVIRAVSGQPLLDVIKLVKYRSDFYGRPMQRVTSCGNARTLSVVDWRPRADGRMGIEDE